MKKNIMNFWMDILIFANFFGVIFTGVLLHRFSYEASERTILGITRYDWGDIHWTLSLIFIILIFAHLVLHWNWAKVNFKKYLRMKPKTLITIVILLTIFIGIFVPAYLTKDFPNKKDFEDSYPKLSHVEVEKKD
jgi:uncharacterized membrane protein (UPF0182 family)